MAVVLDEEKVIRGCQKGIDCLPVEQVADAAGNRIRCRLIQPRNHLTTSVGERLSRNSLRFVRGNASKTLTVAAKELRHGAVVRVWGTLDKIEHAIE